MQSICYVEGKLKSIRKASMSKQFFRLSLLAAAFLAVSGVVYAQKPTAEIEIQKAVLRAEKSALIEQRKTELRTQKAAELEQQREEQRLMKQQMLEAEQKRLQNMKEDQQKAEMVKLQKQEEAQKRAILNREAAIKRHANLLAEKFLQYEFRLKRMMAKIKERADFYTNQGLDVGETYLALTAAEAELEVAKNATADAVTILSEMDVTEPKNLGAALQEVKVAVKEARQAYAQVLQSLRLAFTTMMSSIEALEEGELVEEAE